VLKISSKDELLAIYGAPTNSAERYFYHGISELLNSPASIYTYRLPYGEGSGAGFGANYSALVYPVKSYAGSTTSSVSSFTVNLNFAQNLSSIPLSGAAFKFQTATGIPKTVVYGIGGAAPARTGDIVVNVLASDTYANIITKTTGAISSSANSLGVTVYGLTTSSFSIILSGYVPYTEIAATSASVLPGLDDDGDIFGITAATTLVESGAGLTNSLDITEGVYVLGDPVHVSLTEDEYFQAREGSLFDWSSTGANRTTLSAVGELGKSGVVVLNKAQTTINNQFEGFYLGVADNTNLNPASPFNAILGAKTLSQSATYTSNYTTIPTGTLQFSLSSEAGSNKGSISQVMENLTDYDIDGREDDDLLNIGVFKLRKSLYATESFKLD